MRSCLGVLLLSNFDRFLALLFGIVMGLIVLRVQALF
jgi:uncharacterized membrane protein required for colicin V production